MSYEVSLIPGSALNTEQKNLCTFDRENNLIIVLLVSGAVKHQGGCANELSPSPSGIHA